MPTPKFLEEVILDINRFNNFDDFLQFNTPVGSVDQSLSNTLYGFNHQSHATIMPANKDNYGFTFLTRPQLNLTSANLRNIRKFYNYLTKREGYLHPYIRKMLDPRLSKGGVEVIESSLINNKQGFIPVLTNTLKTVSGWPDMVLPTYTSQQGLMKEQHAMGDGSMEIYDSYDLDLTFKNTKDEPIILMFQLWIMYISYVFRGKMSPYIDFLRANEIDYNTRIYRLVMDENKRFVKKVAATGAAFPITVPSGKFFDYSSATNYNDQTKDINIRFKSMGAEYNDAITFLEFNEVSSIFNTRVRNMLDGELDHGLEKIPYNMLDMLNYRGYPIINMRTSELEWWIESDSLTLGKLRSLREGV